MKKKTQTANSKQNKMTYFLDKIETIGNLLPDPTVLFVALLFIVWGASFFLSNTNFMEIDPRTSEPLIIKNLLQGDQLANFLSTMVTTFTGFAPLGIVLVAMLGVGVAEKSGYINTGLKQMLRITPIKFLTPTVITVAIISHVAADAGYVVVIPLAAVLYKACGRHPLTGIAAAFAGVSGGFSASFIPSGTDPLLQSFTQSAAQILDPDILINPLNNWFFTASSCLFIILVAWYITDKIIEPRLKNVTVDAKDENEQKLHEISKQETKSFFIASLSLILGLVVLTLVSIPQSSPMRAQNGQLTDFSAPLMLSIVPLIFVLFIIPGIVFGYCHKTFKSSKDVVNAMSESMSSLGHYIVMAFFCAQFVAAFSTSNIGALIALKGASFLQGLALPSSFTVVGLIFLVGFVNLFIGSASAKWALIGPILVPMLMQLGISPDLSQAAYRIGDSSTNIITPLLPYFPLIVIYCQKYVTKAGIGTLLSLMIPYSIGLIIVWTVWLLIYWSFGFPLGIQASYVYPKM